MTSCLDWCPMCFNNTIQSGGHYFVTPCLNFGSKTTYVYMPFVAVPNGIRFLYLRRRRVQRQRNRRGRSRDPVNRRRCEVCLRHCTTRMHLRRRWLGAPSFGIQIGRAQYLPIRRSRRQFRSSMLPGLSEPSSIRQASSQYMRGYSYLTTPLFYAQQVSSENPYKELLPQPLMAR